MKTYKTVKMQAYKTLGSYLKAIRAMQSNGWRTIQVNNGCSYNESILFEK